VDHQHLALDPVDVMPLTPEVLDGLPDLAAQARAIADGVLPGLHPSLHRGPSAELVDRRAYVPGDDPRRIDWRVYARTRQLLVKRARRDADLPVHVVLDASASMAFRGPRAPRSKFDHARLLAAALVHVFLRAGDRVALLGFGAGAPRAIAPRGGGVRNAAPFAATLERMTAGGSGDAVSALRALAPLARRRGVVALVSDLLLAGGGASLEPLGRELRALAAHGHDVIVFQVRDPEEADLSLEGPHRFRDPESNDERIADPRSANEVYRARARAFTEAARALSGRGRIDHALAPTDRSPREPLVELLVRRQRTTAGNARRIA
jgi:uncharacterized protein (DUF58 family)